MDNSGQVSSEQHCHGSRMAVLSCCTKVVFGKRPASLSLKLLQTYLAPLPSEWIMQLCFIDQQTEKRRACPFTNVGPLNKLSSTLQGHTQRQSFVMRLLNWPKVPCTSHRFKPCNCCISIWMFKCPSHHFGVFCWTANDCGSSQQQSGDPFVWNEQASSAADQSEGALIISSTKHDYHNKHLSTSLFRVRWLEISPATKP